MIDETAGGIDPFFPTAHRKSAAISPKDIDLGNLRYEGF